MGEGGEGRGIVLPSQFFSGPWKGNSSSNGVSGSDRPLLVSIKIAVMGGR